MPAIPARWRPAWCIRTTTSSAPSAALICMSMAMDVLPGPMAAGETPYTRAPGMKCGTLRHGIARDFTNSMEPASMQRISGASGGSSGTMLRPRRSIAIATGRRSPCIPMSAGPPGPDTATPIGRPTPIPRSGPGRCTAIKRENPFACPAGGGRAGHQKEKTDHGTV